MIAIRPGEGGAAEDIAICCNCADKDGYQPCLRGFLDLDSISFSCPDYTVLSGSLYIADGALIIYACLQDFREYMSFSEAIR